MRFIVYLALIFWSAGLQNSEAQDLSEILVERGSYVVQHWDNSNGLPVNSVSDLLRGRDGYLWISTFDGLVRFDGDEFTTFKPNAGSDNASISNRFIYLTETGKSELLLHTDQGQLVLFKDGEFELLIPDESFSTSVVNQISKGTGDNTIIAANDGIWNYENGELKRVFPNLVKDNIINAIQVGENDFWYEGLRSRIGRIYKGGISTIDVSPRNEFTILKFASVPSSKTYYTIWKNNIYRVNGEEVTRIPIFNNESIVLTDLHYADNKIYLSSQGDGFFIYHTDSQKLEKLPAHTGRTTSGNPINVTSAGDILMGFYNGLSIEANEFIFAPENDYIRTFHTDDQDNIWAITSNSGIYLLTKNKFKTFTHNDGFINTNTYPITERSNGTIVAGSYGDFITYIYPDGTVKPVVQPYSIDPGAYTLSLLESYTKRFYVGTYMDGLFEYVNDKYEPITFTSYDNLSVYALYEDTDQNIWVGTDKGVFFKSSDEDWKNVGFIPIPTTRIVRVFKESSDGTMFMGTNGDGLYFINRGEVKHLNIGDGLSSNFVRDIYIDSVSYGKTQRILVATENNGLNHVRFNENKPTEITRITEQDGLYSNGVHQIFKDEFGRFWMGSNKGIFWIRENELGEFANGQRKSISSVAYTEKDGLSNREVNGGVQPAGMVDRNGNIWFPTQGGPVKIDPGSIELTEVQLPVKIESIKTSDSLYQFLPEQINLNKYHRTLTFKYTSLNIRESENVRFRYRFKPVQENWIYTGDRREALLSNLPSGNLQFQVQASINGQNWENNQASVEVLIPGYWYELWWVRLLGIILFLGLSGSGIFIVYRDHSKREYQLQMALQKYQNDTKALESTLLEKNRSLEKQVELQKQDLKKEYLELRSRYSQILSPLADSLHIPNIDKNTSKQLIDGIFQLRTAFFNYITNRLNAYPKKFDQQWEPIKINVNTVLLPFGRHIKQWADNTGVPVIVEVGNEHKLIIQTDPVFFDITMFGLFSLLSQHTSSDTTIQIQVQTKSDEVILKFSVPVQKVSPAPDVVLDKISEFITFMQPVNTHISAFDSANELIIRSIFPLVESETYSSFQNTVDRKDIDVFSPTLENGEETGEKASILIVDDELVTRTFLKSVLSPYYNVISLDDPTQVMDHIKKQPPSFIITDYYMPAMSGIELLSKIKETGLNVPVILLTGATEEAIHSNSLRAGANIVLHKPVHARVLLEHISTLFREHYLKQKEESPSSNSENNGTILPYNDPFIDKISELLEQTYFDSELTVETIAEQLFIDRSQLYRKLKKITGLSPTGVVQEFRLNKARKMITESDLNVSEVALATGFNSLSYFSRSYKEKFGESPSKTTTIKNT
jgi:ligand-binding sensor domain-containing protein/DNA-binding response OmpR family regulator